MSTRLLLAVILATLSVSVLQAQEEPYPDNPLFPRPRPKRVFVGPLIGYNSNFHGGGFNTLGDPTLAAPECGAFTTGGGNGILIGLAGEYWFKPGGPTALQLRVYYEQKPGSFTSVTAQLPNVDANGVIHYFNGTYKVASKYNLFNVELQYKYNIPGLPHFGVAVGPKVGFHISSTYLQTMELTPGFVFQDGSNSKTIEDFNKIPDVKSVRIALVAHVQYEALVGPFLFTPRVLYDLGVTKVSSAWSVSSLAGSLEIKYGF